MIFELPRKFIPTFKSILTIFRLVSIGLYKKKKKSYLGFNFDCFFMAIQFTEWTNVNLGNEDCKISLRLEKLQDAMT